MFFTAKNFEETKLDQEILKHIAKIANETINNYGLVIYGTRYSDNTLDGFSSVKQDMDTHVALAIGLREMGMFQPTDKLVHADEPSPGDKAIAEKRYLAALEREKNQLREMLNKYETPKAPGGHPHV